MLYKQLWLITYCLFIINAAEGMNENTKFFLKAGKNNIAISQEGIKNSQYLEILTKTKKDVDFDATKDVIFDATTNEAVIPFSSSFAVNPGVKNTTLFAQLCEGKEPIIPRRKLPLLIHLAEYYEVDKSLTEPLKKTLNNELKSKRDEDYVQFLSGKGFLWKTMLMIPHKVIESMYIINDRGLSFDQTVLTRALRMFRPNNILAKKKNSDEPLGENPRLLSLIASLPVLSLQLCVQPIVEEMIKNFEEALKCKKFLANKPYREEQFTKIKRLHTILEQKHLGLTEFKNLSQKYS